MAITYGSNIGSSSAGAFAVLPVTDSVGGASFAIFDADVVSGAVTAVSGNLPLTARQLVALSDICAKIVTIGTVGGNELEHLQKLVGVLPMTATGVVTLSVANIAGNVWRLSASISVAGTVVVYIPNSAACGIFTGVGAATPNGPTGPAGGVLGYPGSTYPNPNGLASPAGNRIPIKPRVGGGVLTVNPDDAVAEATDMTYRGGNGAVGRGGHLTQQAGDTTDVANIGGSHFIDAGTGPLGNGRVDIGVTNADTVRVGRSGKTTQLLGRFQAYPQVESAVGAGAVITPDRATVWMSSAGPVTLDATTPVADLGAGAVGVEGGDRVTLVNLTANTITVPAGGNVLLAGGAACVLDQYGSISLQWLGRVTAGVIQKWVEVSRVTTPS